MKELITKGAIHLGPKGPSFLASNAIKKLGIFHKKSVFGTLLASIIILPLEKMEEAMTHDQMLKRISELESINDQLLSEIRYLDHLLREVGFEEGLKTLKFAAKELIEQDKEERA